MKVKYKLRRYGFQRFGILDNYKGILIKNKENQLILFNSKENAKSYMKYLEAQK